MNNGGYLSIRTTQSSFFQGNFVGESPRSGVSFPDMVRIAEAYGIPARRIVQNQCPGEIESALTAPGPFLCEVMLDPAQEFEPRLTSRILPDGRMVSSPLEDLYPFLDPEELRANMLEPLAGGSACPTKVGQTLSSVNPARDRIYEREA
jgi:acetolactate synthase-1/2/3 large subunit